MHELAEREVAEQGRVLHPGELELGADKIALLGGGEGGAIGAGVTVRKRAGRFSGGLGGRRCENQGSGPDAQALNERHATPIRARRLNAPLMRTLFSIPKP